MILRAKDAVLRKADELMNVNYGSMTSIVVMEFCLIVAILTNFTITQRDKDAVRSWLNTLAKKTVCSSFENGKCQRKKLES